MVCGTSPYEPSAQAEEAIAGLFLHLAEGSLPIMQTRFSPATAKKNTARLATGRRVR